MLVTNCKRIISQNIRRISPSAMSQEEVAFAQTHFGSMGLNLSPRDVRNIAAVVRKRYGKY